MKNSQKRKIIIIIIMLDFIKYNSKLVTLVKGDLKAPFSIATTLRCRGGVLLIRIPRFACAHKGLKDVSFMGVLAADKPNSGVKSENN